MKEQIRAAQAVVPCADLSRTLEFYTTRLGFRLEVIYPADAPRVAIVSGFGLNLRLEQSTEIHPLTLKLIGDFAGETMREIVSPDGARICLIDENRAVEIPDGTPEFVVSKLAGEDMFTVGRAGMLYRDLLPSRLNGRFIASHIRITTGGEVADYAHYHKIRFQMIYCVAGSARLVYENQGAPFVMKAGDCVLQPPEIRHRVLECSKGFEVVEIGSPAVHETHAEYKFDLPDSEINFERTFGGQRFAHHVADRSVWTTSDIEGFTERDTGVAKATKGLADARVLRAEAAARCDVRHAGEFLFYFMLDGDLRLSGEDEVDCFLTKYDCFVLPAGKKYSIETAKGAEMLRVKLPA